MLEIKEKKKGKITVKYKYITNVTIPDFNPKQILQSDSLICCNMFYVIECYH
jgi:hypothetical protein